MNFLVLPSMTLQVVFVCSEIIKIDREHLALDYETNIFKLRNNRYNICIKTEKN